MTAHRSDRPDLRFPELIVAFQGYGVTVESIYTGGERLPFGERLEAWPLATLWTAAR